VALEVRGSTYEFDPATGLLVSATAKGRTLIQGMRPTIWRPLNANERNIYTRRFIDPGKFPDLDKHTIRVKKWRATAGSIEAETEHVADERNKFNVRWSYTPLADGSLKIAYAITPQVEVPWVPEAGLELKTDAGLDKLRWLGLGPLDSFPNLKAAVMFGVWRLNAGEAAGVKSGVRWAELTMADNTGVRVEGTRTRAW
jgi:beta-galactosidase